MTGTGEDRAERLNEQRLIVAFARLAPNALGISCAVVASVLLFAVTAALILKGAPEGQHIGPHLRLLHYYFPGYSVTWGGACIGLAWGFAAGYLGGFLFAAVLNFHHRLYLRLIQRGLRRLELLNG